MLSKALSRTLSLSLKACNPLSSVVPLRVVSFRKLSTPLQWQRTLSTSPFLRNDQSHYEDRSSKPRGFRRPVAPSGTLYIGNLPYSITEEELRQSFMEFGEIVRVTLGTTPEGMSRGFAHIEFSSIEEANGVVKADNEDPIFIMNRDIFLDHAAVQEKTVQDPYHTLFIRPFNGAESDLREMFRDFDNSVTDVRLLKDRETGESRRIGFVEFKDVESATEALEALKDQRDPSSGRQILLKYAKPARLDSTDDFKSRPDGKKRRFNPKGGDERGSRRRHSYGDDWKGPQRTENYRDS